MSKTFLQTDSVKKRFLTHSFKGELIVVPYDGGGPLTGEINQLSTSLIKF